MRNREKQLPPGLP